MSRLKRDEDILEVWGLIWTDENLSQKDQSGLINLFIATVNKVKSSDTKLALVRYLTKNLDKVQLYDGEVFDELARFACRCYMKERGVEEAILDELQTLSLSLMLIAFGKDDASGLLKNRLFAVYESFSDRKMQDKILADLLEVFVANNVEVRMIFSKYAFLKKFVVENSNEAKKKKTTFKIYNSFFTDALLTRKDSIDSFSRQIERITGAIFPMIDMVFWFDMLTLDYFCLSKVSNETDFDVVIDEWCGYARGYGMSQQFKSMGGSVDPFSWNRRDYAEDVIKSMLVRNRQAEEETAKIVSVLLPELSANLIKYTKSRENKIGNSFSFNDELEQRLARLFRWGKMLRKVAAETNL